MRCLIVRRFQIDWQSQAVDILVPTPLWQSCYVIRLPIFINFYHVLVDVGFMSNYMHND